MRSKATRAATSVAGRGGEGGAWQPERSNVLEHGSPMTGEHGSARRQAAAFLQFLTKLRSVRLMLNS